MYRLQPRKNCLDFAHARLMVAKHGSIVGFKQSILIL
nr:MAG TPA: hypothetical protein [Caudoviricetes sp.]